MPSEQTAVEPGGTTTVVCEGGGGLLLLKLRHPPSSIGSSKNNSRMRGSSPAIGVSLPIDSACRSSATAVVSQHCVATTPELSLHLYMHAWRAWPAQQIARFPPQDIGRVGPRVATGDARWRQRHIYVGLPGCSRWHVVPSRQIERQWYRRARRWFSGTVGRLRDRTTRRGHQHQDRKHETHAASIWPGG